MKTYTINNKQYRLPNDLNEFQIKMYVHLINWKWKYISTEPEIFGENYFDEITNKFR